MYLNASLLKILVQIFKGMDTTRINIYNSCKEKNALAFISSVETTAKLS